MVVETAMKADLETRILDCSFEQIGLAAALLLCGKLVAFPTETVYGLGADAANDGAVRRIFEVKGRPQNNPLILHVDSAETASRWAGEWPEVAERLARAFWPGPLTLVVPASGRISATALAGGNTAAFRAPAHEAAFRLLRACGKPIAAPSANASGSLSPVEASHVMADIGGRIDAIVDGGKCTVGIESTVVDLTGGTPVILRPGMISRQQLEEVLGYEVNSSPHPVGEMLKSPGLLERHYAPKIPLYIKNPEQMRGAPEEVACIMIGTANDGSYNLPNDPEGAASQLYGLLWEIQDKGFREIWMQPPPEEPNWLAVTDRLRRASKKAD